MTLELEIYDALCSTSTFVVNGIQANSRDFGFQGDEDTCNAEEYGCGDMRFRRDSPRDEILEKYSITKEEFHEIAEKLEKGLSFGCCGWCV